MSRQCNMWFKRGKQHIRCKGFPRLVDKNAGPRGKWECPVCAYFSIPVYADSDEKALQAAVADTHAGRVYGWEAFE